MSQKIHLNKLEVQAVIGASGISCGKNLQMSVKSISKQNHGYGVVSGDNNTIPAAVNTINDADILDSYLDMANTGHNSI